MSPPERGQRRAGRFSRSGNRPRPPAAPQPAPPTDPGPPAQRHDAATYEPTTYQPTTSQPTTYQPTPYQPTPSAPPAHEPAPSGPPAFDAPTYYLPREPRQPEPQRPDPRHDQYRPEAYGYDDHSPTDYLPPMVGGVAPRAVRPPSPADAYRPPPTAQPQPQPRRHPTRPYEPPDPAYDQGNDTYGAGAFGRPPGAPLPEATTVGPSGSAAAVPKVTVTRAVAARSGQAAQTVARRVVAASRANGASESGLTQLIWNQVLSFGADAMVTVALAGTVFFSATAGAQKGNVLSYLLITMAPFAVVAPVIGPVLDRLQHGRRWAMAASGFGRAVLAVLMAQNFHNLYLLFPLALGSLVLSKAYSVVRAAAAPRLVPPDMTLVTANARLSIFGLGAAVVGGGFIAGVVRVTGSYPLGLWVTAVGFAVTGYFSLRLPPQVDSAAPARQHPEEPRRPVAQVKVAPLARIQTWASKGFGRQVITSMQGESVLRFTAGFLTMFLAFYIERTSHGFAAATSLSAVGVAVAVGNVIGTGAGARFSLGHPHVIVVICSGVCALACVLTAFTFSLETAVACMAVTSAANSLGKLSLDAVIQRDVGETLRSSAFARSETFLQLAWVLGAAVALLLPSDRGTLGMSVAGVVVSLSVIYIVLRSRAEARSRVHGPAPGNV